MAIVSSREISPTKVAPRNDAQALGTAFLGPEIAVDGTVSGTEFLLIEGTLRGKISLSSDLRIGPRAHVEAVVHARNVTIEGKLTGDASADDRLELLATADVEGNLKAPKIVVAEGAKFRGNVDMGSPVPQVEA
jgi:cytoskeletal protein CcmA (bactofilin family)